MPNNIWETEPAAKFCLPQIKSTVCVLSVPIRKLNVGRNYTSLLTRGKQACPYLRSQKIDKSKSLNQIMGCQCHLKVSSTCRQPGTQNWYFWAMVVPLLARVYSSSLKARNSKALGCLHSFIPRERKDRSSVQYKTVHNTSSAKPYRVGDGDRE